MDRQMDGRRGIYRQKKILIIGAQGSTLPKNRNLLSELAGYKTIMSLLPLLHQTQNINIERPRPQGQIYIKD